MSIKLPKHDAGLVIYHNEHKNCYEPIDIYVHDLEFISEQSKRLCIQNDDIWEIQWYPDTPIGFYRVAAHSLEALFNFFNNEFIEVNK